jgi:hypothetical protein
MNIKTASAALTAIMKAEGATQWETAIAGGGFPVGYFIKPVIYQPDDTLFVSNDRVEKIATGLVIKYTRQEPEAEKSECRYCYTDGCLGQCLINA